MSEFVCFSCEAHPVLRSEQGLLTCPTCGKSYTEKQGIPMFTADRYWGEMPEQDMMALLASIERDGFDKPMSELQLREPGVFQFMMDPARADWRFGMEIRKTDVVLDVGCGMGGNTFGLCDRVERVVSFDLSWARAKFVQLRAVHEGKKNITVFAGDFMELPLAEGQFDVIVFNGILEWVGQSLKFEDPYEVQQWVMKKCLRLLKPGGRMYVGIENRFCFSYLTGADHIMELNSVAWMPRFFARWYCRKRINKDYRTYTHGKSGYVKLFRDAGFTDISVQLPYPGYNDQRVLIPFDDVRCLRYAIANLMGTLSWKKRLVKWVSAIPGVLEIYRYFFFSYDIYGVKPPADATTPRETRIKLHNGVGFRNPKVSFISFADGKPSLFKKTVRFERDAFVIERSHEALARANRLGLNGVPKAVSLERVQGIPVSAETIVPGRPLDREQAHECEMAFRWLEAFAVAAKDGSMSARDMRAMFDRLLTEMKSSDAEFLKLCHEYFDSCLAMAGGEALQIPSVPAHGDFTPSNVLVDGSRMGVIDWDRYGEITVPLFDLFTFVERITPKKQNMFLVGKAAIERQAAQLGIGLRAIPLLIFFYVLLSDWRKRERMFPWEPARWDRDTLALMKTMLSDVHSVFG